MQLSMSYSTQVFRLGVVRYFQQRLRIAHRKELVLRIFQQGSSLLFFCNELPYILSDAAFDYFLYTPIRKSFTEVGFLPKSLSKSVSVEENSPCLKPSAKAADTPTTSAGSPALAKA